MTDDRLPTHLWIDIHLRQLTLAGTPYTIINKGAPSSGTVMLKLYAAGQGALVLQQQRDETGAMAWLALFDGAPVPESKADDYINRAITRDPDLWVIEIEDKSLKNPFEGKLLT